MFDDNPHGEKLPDVALDNVDITGVDNKLPETSFITPVKIPGVDSGSTPGVEPGEQQQTIEINDINVSGQQELTLMEPVRPATARRSERQTSTKTY